jgi:murein DD-endopeptidase MepM/ murein hydrolase activator NlpD
MQSSRFAVFGCVVVIAGAMMLVGAGQRPLAQIDVRVNVAPTPLRGSDGQTSLAYELLATNLDSSIAARLDRLDVFAESESKPLITYSSHDLDERVMRPETDPKARYSRLVPGGATALIYIWVSVPRNRAVPKTLRHSFSFAAEDGATLAAGDASVDVRFEAPLFVGSPFRSGTWFAHNGPGNHRAAHWGSALIAEGRARIPQRFAIDFIGVDSNGRAVRGDVQKSANGDWIGFGQEIVAVADAVIYDARDGVTDNQPLVEPPRPSSPSAAETYGNYVIAAINSRTFVHYAHLQHNSVAVRTGQTVRRGDLIGRLGNSGNTNGPHLHFNITDRSSPEEAQGLPFVFDGFEVRGRTTADAAIGGEPPPRTPRISPAKRRMEILLDGTVVQFR